MIEYLRRLRWALRWRTRQLVRAQGRGDRLLIRQHRRESHVLARPGLLGFSGGAFNPGVLGCGPAETRLLAKAQRQHWVYATRHNPAHLGDGAPIELTVSADGTQRLSARSCRFTAPDDSTHSEWAEDFRSFRFRDQVLVNHSLVRHLQGNRFAARQVISQWHPEPGSLRYIAEPELDFATAGMEKNWVYLEHEGRLFMFYSFSPLRVLERVHDTAWRFETRINQPLEAPLTDPGHCGGWVSWSTNPVSYDSESLLVFVHQVDRSRGRRRYLNWAVLLSRRTFIPTHISRTPVLDGRWARGMAPGVLYLSAVLPRGKDFLLFCGEGDSHISSRWLTRSSLQQQWRVLVPAPTTAK